MKYRLSALLSLGCALAIVLAVPAAAADSPDALKGMISHLGWRCIGPSNMSGRIADIEARDSDFRHVLVATASGGVYKSDNAGTTWTPIFDRYGSASIGDVAMFQQDPNVIWVGTGEAAVRNSVAWGDGIYKSSDGGRSFVNVGLRDSGHIARVVTHPSDPDLVYVAAQGHLWGWTGERGLFKTENGGKSWEKLTGGLPGDGRSGCTDLIMDPRDPGVLYAAFWERIRTPYNFTSGGPNGGIFKSEDGGKSWLKLGKGLPVGDTGRIGLSLCRSKPQVVMAWVEHGFQPPARLKNRKPNPEYSDMRKLGSGIYRSENGGRDWKYMNRYHNRPFYYTQIRVDPHDDRIVYFLAGRIHVSHDGGRTLEPWNRTKIHVDHHALWCDPVSAGRFYLGTDGGAALTHDHGGTFIFFHNLVASQFYALGVDMQDPFRVYGGLQDNGTWGGPSRTRDPNGILKDHWIKIGGGDGFHVQVDPLDWRTVYFESQGGSANRHDVLTGRTQSIKPNRRTIVNYDEIITKEMEKTGRERGFRDAFRFNWSSPILLSKHNPRTLYFGGNFLFRSVDRGASWVIISPDLSSNDPQRTRRDTGGLTKDITGAETYGTIVTVAESPRDPLVLWAGTDDGRLHVTKDGGGSWTAVRSRIPDVPEWTWVSRVEASAQSAGRAYVTFDGHRGDDFSCYAFRTDDYGESWVSVRGDLPEGSPLYVIREDPACPGLLFAGSEFACFVTLNGGESWQRFMTGMPTVAVHDLVIHPREPSLVAGTHGRGIWICDDISPLRGLGKMAGEQDSALFAPERVTRWRMVQRNDPRMGYLFFSGENPPQRARLHYVLKQAADSVVLVISDISEKELVNTPLAASAGSHVFDWDLCLQPGEAQRKRFRASLAKAFGQIRDAVSDEGEMRALDSLEKRLESAERDSRLRKIAAEVGERFGKYLPRFQARLRGRPVPVGSYRITLRVDGREHTRVLSLREDPILQE